MNRLIAFAFLAICGTAIAQECLIDNERLDCYPEPNSSQDKCLQRGCTWCPAEVDGNNIPWCFIPKSYGYRAQGDPVMTPNGFTLTLTRATDITLYGGDAETLTMTAEFQSDYRLRIKFTDGTPRWEVPLDINPPAGGNTNRLYEVEVSNDPVFSFKVIRKATGTVLFDTSLGGFTFADQFLQFSTLLPSKNVYGLGEQEHHSLRHTFEKFPAWPSYARDQPPSYTANMYGTHPYYTVLEEDGNTHSVLVLNSNAQEFVMLPTPGILYRTIGGILDLYFFLGPTPENVVQQYTEAIGRSFLPPYWALGFQICRYGYNTLTNMQTVVSRTRAANIPHDVQYGDIDIMERALDFTVDPVNFAGLADYVKQLKTMGIKFLTILDPCISIGEPAGTYRAFDLGNEMDVWVKKADGSPVIGKVWPEDPVYFPDYSKDSTREWWIQMIKEFHDILEWDGLWIDMNEPANFITGDMTDGGCPTTSTNNPPFVPGIVSRYLGDKTICPDHVDSKSTHYNTHNLYGWFESEPTQAGVKAAIPGKRPFVLSRSTFVGSGRWASHWLGDNFSNWANLFYSIIGMLEFNQFGIPFVGADICGFIGDTEEELCQRWLELGAFYPFSRNHNGIGYKDQDPASFGAAVAESTRKALEVRYTLLPYLFTLFYDHWSQGNTVARAVWHEFPQDEQVRGLDTQFMWGQGFMVSPVLEQGATSKQIYFPDNRWYNWYDGTEVPTRGASATVQAPRDYIPLHVRGGVILPTQEPALNTELSRQNPIGFTVALDDNNESRGKLYYDDGVSDDSLSSGAYYLATYVYRNGALETTVENDGYPVMATLKVNTIRLLGAKNISKATVDGVSVATISKSDSGEVTLTNLNIPANKAFKIVFE